MYMEMAPGLSEEAMTLGATELEICSAFNIQDPIAKKLLHSLVLVPAPGSPQ